MRTETKNENILNYIYIIIGTTILAAGINMFLAKLKLVTGGVTGLAIVIRIYYREALRNRNASMVY